MYDVTTGHRENCILKFEDSIVRKWPSWWGRLELVRCNLLATIKLATVVLVIPISIW
jgi:hypothetical protein